MEQAVIVQFEFDPANPESVLDLSEMLEEAVANSGAGEYDGHEVAVGSGRDGRFYLYGPDAERLFEVIRPVLENSSLAESAIARLRFGPPADGVREEFRKIRPQHI